MHGYDVMPAAAVAAYGRACAPDKHCGLRIVQRYRSCVYIDAETLRVEAFEKAKCRDIRKACRKAEFDALRRSEYFGQLLDCLRPLEKLAHGELLRNVFAVASLAMNAAQLFRGSPLRICVAE